MEIAAINSSLDGAKENFTKEQVASLLSLIDLKTNTEMKDVLSAIGSLDKKVDRGFEDTKQDFERIDKRFGRLYTIISIVVATVALLVTVLSFLK